MLRPRVGIFRAVTLAGFVLATIVLFNLGSWFFYSRARAALEQEIRSRIVLSTRFIAHELEVAPVFRSESFRLYDSARESTVYDEVRSAFLDWSKQDSDISGVFLMDLQGQVLVSTADDAVRGAPYPFLGLDKVEIQNAQSGSFTSTSPESRESLFFMNAYGPVKSEGGMAIPEFILGVKADSRYERTFSRIRNGIIVANLLSGLTVILLAVLLYRAEKRLAKEEQAFFETEKLATLGQLAAGLAHEIRNPLGVMQQVAVQFRRKADFEGAESSLEYLEDAIRRINKQVEDVLAYTRRDFGEHKPGDIGATIERALSVLQFKIRKAGVEIVKEFEPIGPILYDHDRMEQAALNLILNAVEAMPNGGRLTIGIRGLPAGVEIVFEDTGPGVDRSMREKIFEPFQSSKEQGTGLGLAIVRRIVQNHGGDVVVEGEPGVGARFILRLPVKDRQ